MFEIVLFQPEIPPNTGNVMRLAANTGCRLHLVRPLGFTLSDKQLQRAGMDYRDRSQCVIHDDWQTCLDFLGKPRYYALTTKGNSRLDQTQCASGDVFVFGPETSGLPTTIMDQAAAKIRLPMREGSRSLNLANSVAIVVYEAWRQCGYKDAL